jgi:hypothetical protein
MFHRALKFAIASATGDIPGLSDREGTTRRAISIDGPQWDEGLAPPL